MTRNIKLSAVLLQFLSKGVDCGRGRLSKTIKISPEAARVSGSGYLDGYGVPPINTTQDAAVVNIMPPEDDGIPDDACMICLEDLNKSPTLQSMHTKKCWENISIAECLECACLCSWSEMCFLPKGAPCIENELGHEWNKILPCGHRFHKNCIDKWFEKHDECPICKREHLPKYPKWYLWCNDIFAEDDDVETDNQPRHVCYARCLLFFILACFILGMCAISMHVNCGGQRKCSVA